MPKIPLPLLGKMYSSDSGIPGSASKVDCSYCTAPCCRLVVELVGREHEEFEWEWSLDSPRKFRAIPRRDDGYCAYYVVGKGCSTYDSKPAVCNVYSCRMDARITPALKYSTPDSTS